MNFDSITITIDEDSYCWSLDATASDLDTWIECAPGNTITFTINNDNYVFLIDSRERTSEFESTSESFTIAGRSPTSEYDNTSLYQTWESVTVASVIEELIPGTVVDIPNWTLLDGLLVADGETAIEIVTNLAEAAGGILYTDTEGTLHVVPKYKTAPANYDYDDTDLTITDTDDIFTLTESTEVMDGYNQVEVSDQPDQDESSISISEESINETELSAVIRVDVYPFVSSMELYTSQDDVTVTLNGVYTETIEDEVVEIIDGVGSTENLVKEISSYEYLGTDMGDLTATGQSLQSEVSGTTLVKVTYVTQYLLFDVQAETSDTVQLYTTN